MLVKMRQPKPIPDSLDVNSLDAKGILRQEEGRQTFKLELFEPHLELKPWIEYYWAVEWDLGDEIFVQTVITNPTIDLSFENDPIANHSDACVIVTGVVPRSYQRILRGHANVFAIHFHPGMFRPWWGESVKSLTGKAERLGSGQRHWEIAANELVSSVLNQPNASRVQMIDTFLLEHRPVKDTVGEDIRDLVLAARHERALWETDAMARQRGVSIRTNQRQFLEYVGTSPKWVIQRYRIQAAIDILDTERIGSGKAGDLTQLALDLGYFDHAHFSRDFRNVTGYTPNNYRKVQGSPS
jgi:AraC-like DNA-binding protein